MIVLLDTGFKSLPTVYSSGNPSGGGHGKMLYTIIKGINTNIQIDCVDLGNIITEESVKDCLNWINSNYNGCRVCMSITMPKHDEIDNLICSMIPRFEFVVAAGNYAQPIENLTPAGIPSVTTVGSLNKSKMFASHNSTGHIDVYAPGTNIKVNNQQHSGTSVAMAIFAGYYSLSNTVTEAFNKIQRDFNKLTSIDITCDESSQDNEKDLVCVSSEMGLNYDSVLFQPHLVECYDEFVYMNSIDTFKLYGVPNECHKRLEKAIKNNKIIILNAHPEGYNLILRRSIEETILELFKKHDKSYKGKLYIISGSLDKDMISKSKFQDCLISGPLIAKWVMTVRITGLPYIHDVEKKTRTFLCLNRVVRPHRIALVAELSKRNMLDTNAVSFFKHGSHDELTSDEADRVLYYFIDKYWDENKAKEYKEIIDTFPLETKADDIDYQTNQATTASPIGLYEDTFFSLVTETFFFESELFLSEKIYKPMVHEHPFIIMGPRHSLKELKRQGFKTFGSLIDESYDEIEDHYKRFDAVLTECERIHNLPFEEKQRIFDQARSITLHNKQVFITADFVLKNTYNTDLLYKLTAKVNNIARKYK